MNKQLTKIDELINWLDTNAPEDACVLLLAMADMPPAESADGTPGERRVEIKSFIEGYDEDLSAMLINKMISIPLLQQVFVEALGQQGVQIDTEALLKWRDKNKYDLKFDLLDLPTEDTPTLEGEPAEYIRRVQDFCLWMNEKPSRNLTLLLLAQDELNSSKTTFAMGFAPDLSILLSKEMKDNYGFRTVVESALYGMETRAGFAEFMAWKDSLKK
ncbi:MAG: hypothetical protein RR212_12860 [Bacteroidales bacterium]